MLTAINQFFPHRNMFYRERRDGLYGAGVLLVTYILHAFPWCVLASTLYSVFVYWACNLHPAADRSEIAPLRALC